MSTTAILLIVVAAMMHAGWNLLAKSRQPTIQFFLIANIAGALLLAPAWIGKLGIVSHHIPGTVWLYLAATGFFMAMYYAGLAGAYRAGDMSIAYPLARSSPIIVVSVVTFILGRGHQITPLCAVGIVLVVAGCFLIPMSHFSDFRLANYWNPICGLALLAAFGTAGYSILDDEALRILRHDLAGELGVIHIALLYAGLEVVSTSFWMAALLILRRTRVDVRETIRKEGFSATLAGIIIFAGYAIVLVSLAYVRNVSYVVAFRQLSIPLGALLGILVLKEPGPAPKLLGVAIMCAGLLLVALG